MDNQELSEYYKTISNAELLAILNNAGDYREEAIEAAKNEFTQRRIHESEITEAEAVSSEIKIRNDLQKENLQKLESQVKSAWISFIETLNPVQTGIQTPEKIIRFIIVIFGLLYLYFLATHLGSIPVYIDDFRFSPVAAFFELMPFWFLPVTIYLFWKRTSSGWSLLTFYLCYSIIELLLLLWSDINYKPTELEIFNREIHSPIFFITQFAFAGGVLYAICKPSVRECFKITEDRMIKVLVTSVIITIITDIAIIML